MRSIQSNSVGRKRVGFRYIIPYTTGCRPEDLRRCARGCPAIIGEPRSFPSFSHVVIGDSYPTVYVTTECAINKHTNPFLEATTAVANQTRGGQTDVAPRCPAHARGSHAVASQGWVRHGRQPAARGDLSRAARSIRHGRRIRRPRHGHGHGHGTGWVRRPRWR